MKKFIIKKVNPLKENIVSLLYKIILKIENSGDTDISTNGERVFLEKVIDFYKEKEMIIFDIGANKGEYSQYLVNSLKENKGLFYLFEPQKKCFDDLKNKFLSNKNVVINNFGASDKEGDVDIYFDKEKSSLASIYHRNLDYYGLNMNKSEKILLKRMDKYIESVNIAKINLIKIDVEGHELKVMEGLGEYLSSDFIDFIQFEYGGTNIDSHTNLLDFFELLTRKGFKICKIMKNNLEIREYNPRYDNFAYQNWVAISNNVINVIK